MNLPISMAALHVEFRKPGVVNQNGITGLRRQKKSPATRRGLRSTRLGYLLFTRPRRLKRPGHQDMGIFMALLRIVREILGNNGGPLRVNHILGIVDAPTLVLGIRTSNAVIRFSKSVSIEIRVDDPAEVAKTP